MPLSGRQVCKNQSPKREADAIQDFIMISKTETTMSQKEGQTKVMDLSRSFNPKLSNWDWALNP